MTAHVIIGSSREERDFAFVIQSDKGNACEGLAEALFQKSREKGKNPDHPKFESGIMHDLGNGLFFRLFVAEGVGSERDALEFVVEPRFDKAAALAQIPALVKETGLVDGAALRKLSAATSPETKKNYR